MKTTAQTQPNRKGAPSTYLSVVLKPTSFPHKIVRLMNEWPFKQCSVASDVCAGKQNMVEQISEQRCAA